MDEQLELQEDEFTTIDVLTCNMYTDLEGIKPWDEECTKGVANLAKMEEIRLETIKQSDSTALKERELKIQEEENEIRREELEEARRSRRWTTVAAVVGGVIGAVGTVFGAKILVDGSKDMHRDKLDMQSKGYLVKDDARPENLLEKGARLFMK